jgi:N-methylhydantoinase B
MKSPPFGLQGGQAGAAATVTLTTPDGETTDLKGKGAFAAPAGSIVNMRTTGSGGMGNPSERSAEAVRIDLEDGYVTPEGAARDYGRG